MKSLYPLRILIDLDKDAARFMEVVEVGPGLTGDKKDCTKYLALPVDNYNSLRFLIEDLGLDTSMAHWLLDELVANKEEEKRKQRLSGRGRIDLHAARLKRQHAEGELKKARDVIAQLESRLIAVEGDLERTQKELAVANTKLAILDEIGMELEIKE